MKPPLLGVLLAGILMVLALVLYLNVRGESKIHDAPPLTPPSGETVARGAFLMHRSQCGAGCGDRRTHG